MSTLTPNPAYPEEQGATPKFSSTPDQRMGHHATYADHYSFDQLADIYNQARVDYIVPMPMNGKRMEEYVTHYDVRLESSVVSLNDAQEESGVIMLGVRGTRSWITRLGVIPHRRGNHIGQYLVDLMIAESHALGIQQIQLEVIQGNEAAITLFHKFKFQDTRELLVIRRPPGALVDSFIPENTQIEQLTRDQISVYLQQRENDAAWTEETASLEHIPSLTGYRVTLPDGDSGWAVWQPMPFQLTHLVLSPNASHALATALIATAHQKYPLQDTKVENLPTLHPYWQAFQAVGYTEMFRRIEMILPL